MNPVPFAVAAIVDGTAAAAVISGILSCVSGVTVAVLAYRGSAKRTREIDLPAAHVEILVQVLEQVKDERDHLMAVVDRLEQERDSLERRVRQLEDRR